MTVQDERVEVFRELHVSGCFVMPNPWDVGTALALEQLGFKALATTSAGYAWSLGRADDRLVLDEALEHLRAISGAVRLPVNADFEGGFADDPEQVARNVKLAAATGIAGLSIEDSTREAAEPLYHFELAVERIRAARRAIDEGGTGIVLTGRSEGFVVGRPDIEETIRRLQAYAEAGADCLYAPAWTRFRGDQSNGGASGRRSHRRASRRSFWPGEVTKRSAWPGHSSTLTAGGGCSACGSIHLYGAME